MKTRSIPARRSMTVALGVGAALVVGVAFAVWTQNGAGSGSATAISAKDSTITVDAAAATAGADLYPGATGDLFLKVDNPNPYPVTFTDLSAGTGGILPSDVACAATNVQLNVKSGLAIRVPANTTTAVEHTIAGAVSMIDNANQGCQGVSFTIPVKLTGVSSQ